MSDWHRSTPPKLLLRHFPNVRTWQKEVTDGHLSVIRTIEPVEGQWLMHVSISHRTNDTPPQPGRYPTWDEQKEAVWKVAPGKRMASYLPPEGDPYVNVHETTFHWWETDADLS